MSSPYETHVVRIITEAGGRVYTLTNDELGEYIKFHNENRMNFMLLASLPVIILVYAVIFIGCWILHRMNLIPYKLFVILCTVFFGIVLVHVVRVIVNTIEFHKLTKDYNNFMQNLTFA